MNTLTLIFAIAAFVAVAFAIKFYFELWKWAKQCQNARIAIAYKGRVKINAPILEWLLWTNLMDRDKDAKGRQMYGMGGTNIALIKGFDLKMGFHLFLRETLFRHTIGLVKAVRPSGHKVTAPETRQGRYKAFDQTPKENHKKVEDAARS